jgi:hypothetical protein
VQKEYANNMENIVGLSDELFILSSECIISLLGNCCNGALNYADI